MATDICGMREIDFDKIHVHYLRTVIYDQEHK